jgi:hypothetical protein
MGGVSSILQGKLIDYGNDSHIMVDYDSIE